MTSVRDKKLAPGEVIPLNYDFMFMAIFNKEENIDILENFISSYFEIPLSSVKGNLKLLKRKMDIKNKKEQNNEVDLLFKYNKKTINIELSNERKSTGIIDRNILLASKIHAKQLKYRLQDYKKINETLQINLNNFRCNEKEIKEKYYLRNEKGEILTEKIEIDMVDLVLGDELCYTVDNNKLSKWCRVFLSNKEKEIRKLLEELMERESSEKMMGQIEELCSDDEYVGVYTKLTKRELEYNTFIAEAKEEGFNDGFHNGISQRNNEIIKNMLNKKIDLESISEITGLSIEEIQNINNK